MSINKKSAKTAAVDFDADFDDDKSNYSSSRSVHSASRVLNNLDAEAVGTWVDMFSRSFDVLFCMGLKWLMIKAGLALITILSFSSVAYAGAFVLSNQDQLKSLAFSVYNFRDEMRAPVLRTDNFTAQLFLLQDRIANLSSMVDTIDQNVQACRADMRMIPTTVNLLTNQVRKDMSDMIERQALLLGRVAKAELEREYVENIPVLKEANEQELKN